MEAGKRQHQLTSLALLAEGEEEEEGGEAQGRELGGKN